jgi:hypothetical protein
MASPPDAGSAEERRALLGEILDRVETDAEERSIPEGPGPGAEFKPRYDHLVGSLELVLESVPEVEHEPLGSSGTRIAYPATEREVRITPLEDQELVHFVFGHAALAGRAEHHASRPFGDVLPNIPKLAAQILAFLIVGDEPKWLTHRPPADSSVVKEAGVDSEVLELPLD